MSIHDGHRKRVKDRFRKEGLDGFDELHVLELMLFYCIPQRDTNLLAHALLDRFGSLAQILEAPAEELEKVPGVGENVSTFLNLSMAVARYYLVSLNRNSVILTDTDKCGEYLKSFFLGRRDEYIYALCLDAKCKVLCCREVGRGNVNSAALSVRRIVETALSVNATSVVLAHNHPSGIAVPSMEDAATTRRVAMALDAVDIILSDHVVVAEDDFVSMVQSGFYRPSECRALI